MTNGQIIATLEKYRVQLSDTVSKPIGIASYRNDLVRDISALHCCNCRHDEVTRLTVSHLKELKETRKKIFELEQACVDAKKFENKMHYSINRQQIDVARKKGAELTKEIDHLLRTSEMVVQNRKRLEVEIEKLDTIVFKTIRDLPDLSVLEHVTKQYVPLRLTRELSLEAMKAATKKLEETRKIMQSEQLEHRDKIQAIKREIKQTRADITSICDCTHLIQTTFASHVSNNRCSKSNDMIVAREAIKNELSQLQITTEEDAIVHQSNLDAMEKDRATLTQEVKNASKTSAAYICELEGAILALKLEHSTNAAALGHLEERIDAERKKQRKSAEMVKLEAQEKAREKAIEDREHFAVLLIQLRWKRHLKRQQGKFVTAKRKKADKRKNKK